jgi:hypothetical protein
MNPAIQATVSQINKHGKTLSFIVVTEGQYNVETGSATNSEVTYSVKMYKKHIKATQYNYPSLIGKDSAIFFLANYNLSFVPKVKDKIIDSGNTYLVDSIFEHNAYGDIVLYKILAVKG